MLVLFNISKWIPALALLVGFLAYKNLGKSSKAILLFVLLGFLTETFIFFYKLHYAKNTLPIGHVYFPLSFLFLSFFYAAELKGYLNGMLLKIIILFFLLFFITNSLFFQELREFATVQGVTNSLIMLLFSVMLFHKIMLEAKIEKLQNEPVIWFNLAVLINFSGKFTYYFLFKILLDHSMEYLRIAAILDLSSNILFYVLICIGFWLKINKNNLWLTRLKNLVSLKNR